MIQIARPFARLSSNTFGRCYSTTPPLGGRTAPYRRIYRSTNHDRLADLHQTLLLRSLHRPPIPSQSFSTTTRIRAISFKDLKSEDGKKDQPNEAPPQKEAGIDPAEEAYQRATRVSWEKASAERDRQRKADAEQEEQEAKNPEEEGQESKEEEKKGKKEEKKEDAPPPPHGNKSPWQVFTETLKTEFKASKEWNESTKQLSDSAQHFTESESIRRAREAYKSASGAASSGTASAFKNTGRAIGQSAAWTWDTTAVKGLRQGVNVVGKGLDKATKPIRETSAFKSVQDVVDDGSSSKYGGWVEKEERRKRREQRELEEAVKSGRPAGQSAEKIEEDPNAGTNVTLHKDSILYSKWRDFRDSNPMAQRFFSLKSSYNESDNAIISTARSITDRVAGFFAENESAMVIKKFKEMDPTFKMEPFLREMREYILPEVLDAYVKGDLETLNLWLSAPQFQVYSALAQQYLTAGLKSDGKILDIRHVDILSARMLQPGDIPVFIITARTQEVHVYRNSKTNQLAAGMEDKVQQVTYAIGVTRLPEEVSKPETRGWRLIELQKSARDYI